jgi:hypothetical protein
MNTGEFVGIYRKIYGYLGIANFKNGLSGLSAKGSADAPQSLKNNLFFYF